MPDITDTSPGPRAVRDVADAYVLARAELDPLVNTQLGLRPDDDRLPDYSPAGQQAADDLDRGTLRKLDAAVAAGVEDGDERRCARLLRERLEARLAASELGEHLRFVSNIFAPPQRVRSGFLGMPAVTDQDWAVIARRMTRVPDALASYQAALAEGANRGLLAAPRQVSTMAGQFAEWGAAAGGQGWFAAFAEKADVPPALRADLDQAAASASAGVDQLRRWLTDSYLPLVQGAPDAAGEQRYRAGVRTFCGSNLDPRDAYEWGWSQFRELQAEMAQEAQRVLPGGTAIDAMRHLEQHGEAVDGVEEIRQWLQRMMDQAIDDLDGTHFDLADRVKVVQAMIAPPGSAAAPYYSGPTRDFSRPGRTWLPTLGKDRFPLWGLVSTWYHEGVPGHHLQIAQWTHLSDQLSVYQTSLGGVSACSEGWALYAERLMDELGYLSDPGRRLGFLDAENMRAIRVIVDIGMHLQLEIPADWPDGAGQQWTPELAEKFFVTHCGRDPEFIASEIIRYLGAPGQAISYKLGERAWLEGRAAAQAASGSSFDLKSWHMAALSLGALGLDDLAAELAAL